MKEEDLMKSDSQISDILSVPSVSTYKNTD